MKQLLEFIPLVLFFITYKMFGVREAAIVLVIATIIQMVVLKLKYGMIEKQQKIMAIAVIFFGLLTAYFNEIKYLQWKVTIINALFAIVLLVAQFQFNTPLVKKLLGKEIQLPDNVWNKLNVGWVRIFHSVYACKIFISAKICLKMLGLISNLLVYLV